MATDTITLGVQAGDEEAGDTMNGYFMPLRKLLAKNCVGPYSTAIAEFSLVLRIDGKISYWNFEGCDRLRINHRCRYITIDIGVPESRWRNSDPTSIANYLVDCVAEGLKMMVAKLIKSKIEVAEAQLFADFETVRNEYLREFPKSTEET
ncbi:MAG: hypothetical protein SFX18_19130 [Pirellulales bacterium]|nr:hypothetical protein [Pirellulales bacterium]